MRKRAGGQAGESQLSLSHFPTFSLSHRPTFWPACLLTCWLSGLLACGVTARAADGPPSITASPAGRTVLQGSPTTFTVIADGTPPLSYQWRKDGAPLTGATDSSYTINSAQPADEGNYSVVVSNALDVATSAEAEFLVDPGIITGTSSTNLFGYANSWKYNQSGADLGTAWKEAGFNDGAWPSGPGLLGLETTPAVYPETIRTPLALGTPQVITYYLRTHFNLPASAAGATLTSTNLIDDGAVYYLNGNDVGRLRVAASQNSQTLADNQGAEGTPEVLDLLNTGLVVGDNVLAVEVHQSAATSSDVVFGMTLTAAVPIRGPDNVRPTILSVSSPTSSVVLVSFSERVEPASATNKTNYTLNNGATISAAYFTNDNRTIALATSPIAESTSYTLTVNNVRDRAVTPNTILAGSQFNFVRASGSFASQDIGAPTIAGSVSAVAGGYNITAGGTNVFGTGDQFTFNYQQVVGDFDFKVRVAGLTLADAWSKAGLMARETLVANSRYAASFATPSGSGSYFQWRATVGGAALNSGTYPVNYPNTWLRLKRAGNLFTGFASVDGDAWYQLGSASNAMSAGVYIGMAVSASVTNGSAIATTTAQFRDFLPVAPGSGSVATALPDIEPAGPSSRRTPIVITEIMYNPLPDAQSNVLEFIEIYNSNPYFEDIGGWRLSGDIDFTFPLNTTLRAGEYRVIARNPGHVQAAYGLSASSLMGPYANSLKEAGTIRLRNKENAILLEVNYDNQPPWPVAADGAGHSMVLARPSYGEGSPLAWSISDQVGGSPGRYDAFSTSPQRAVVINEFLAHSELTDFVELYNHSNVEVDLSGCTLSDVPSTNKFVMPANTRIQPRGYLVFDQSQLGFGFSSGGETIYLRSADGRRVLDAVRYGPQALGVSSGRYPDGNKEVYPLTTVTPGTANAAILIRDIVINEIMFKPISGGSDDEYVELYNKGASPVDLSNWKFVAGIDYKFPSNVVLAADSYLVVAKNASLLLTNYPNLTTNNTYGDYKGSLKNSGDRVALAMPDVSITTNGAVVQTNTVYVVVDEVTYGPGGQWGNWANEGGSSLELIDPRANHRLAYNWADSDETAKAPWTTIEATDLVNQGAGTANYFEILMLGEGECLVDNVEVIGAAGTNVVTQANSTFESGQGGWQFRGTHIGSTIESSGGFGGGRCLHVRASARGDSIANRCLVSIPTISAGPAVTLRAKVRWLRGWPEILFRLHGNWVEATGRMALPSNLGTPGARNSQAASNAPPAIYAVNHAPVVPAANQSVVVTAGVQDPDGVASVVLRYRLDPTTSYSSVTMNDSGTGGDAVAGDGIYSGTIPGQSSGTLVAFYVQVTDNAGVPLSVTYPRDASPTSLECLVRFGDPVIASGFGTYRQWMKSYYFDIWNNRPALSNQRLALTFVYGNFRAIHFAAVKWAGSPYHQFGGAPNTTGHYSFDIPSDDLFLGTDNLNKIHAPGNGPFDDGYIQREQICYWFARQMGLPWNYRRCINMYFNGVRPGGPNQLMEDTETPGNDVVNSRFSDDPDGDLYKLQPWFEVDDGTARSLGFSNNEWASLTKWTTVSNGVTIHKLARYRHKYLARAVKGSANDYANVFALIDAADSPAGPSHTVNMQGVAEMEQWMRIFAVHHSVGDWDHFGSRNSQNMYGYVSPNTKWTLMIWDMNIVIGNGSSAQGQNLFEITGGGANMQKVYDNPTFRRMYLRALKELCNGAFLPANMDPVLDSKYAAYLASGVSPTPPAGIKSWMATARTAILGVVATEDASTFKLTSTNSVTTDTNLITITGEAPVEARTILVNGIEYAVTWSNVKTFTVRVPVSAASSVLSLRGQDVNGNPIASISTNIAVTYTGPIASPETSLVINEIMYNPARPEASYVEIFNTSNFAFDLAGWRVNGIDFAFDPSAYIAGRQYLVLAKNRAAYTAAYPGAVAPYGQFDGGLDDGGETITLQRPVSTLTTNGSTVTTNIAYVAVDKVRYDDDPPWPAGADGFGPSLQLIDAAQDNSRVSNWTDHEDWRYLTFTGTISGGTSSPGTNFLIFLGGAGDVYLDDFILVTGNQAGVGPNLIVNGGFEFPLSDIWTNQGNHSNSVISTEFSHSGNASLHLIATGPGGQNSSIRQLLPAFATNTLCTVSFWMRPSTNGSVLTIRSFPGSLLVGTNGIRPVFFTPGFANSVAVSLTPYDPLWLNELQPNNLTGITDNHGEREPWIELYNSGATPLDLSGYYLADNYTNLTQWQFPAGSSLAPGDFKILWADGQFAQSTANDWHTNFRLNSQTGSVALVRLVLDKPQITDYLNYSGIGPDLSYGDFPNGQPNERQTFFSPTPGAPNNGREINVFINEWMAANTNSVADPADGAFDDWFELYNPGDTPVDLGGYWLTDNLNAPQGFQVPANGQYVIPPHGFLLVWADGEANQNSDSRIDLHASFQLSKDGEQIGLFAPNGSTLIDGVTFGPQTNNLSEGRFADGASTRYFMTTPTPRGPNTLGAGGSAPVINPIADRTVTLGQSVSFTVTATDADMPPQTLSFGLDAGFPPGAAINSGSGLFTWTPSAAQAPSANVITVRVTDSGAPPLSAALSFTITVRTPPRATITIDGSGHVTLGFATASGKTYRVDFKDNLNDANWLPLGASIMANSSSLTVPDDIGANLQRFYRIVQLD